MVIILQQTLEEGHHRFVSTVVEGSSEETSFTSSFSSNSQHSISERSAVYKQRIDSLFGRGGRLSVTETCVSKAYAKFAEPRLPPTPDIEEEEEEEDDYSRITDKGSALTDSLNHKGGSSAWISTANVSSVRISCEGESETCGELGSIVTISQNECKSLDSAVTVSQGRSNSTILMPCSEGQREEQGERGSSNMWQNGAYSDSPGEGKGLSYVRHSPGGMLQFSVEYLGNVPVDGTTTSLQDLQGPLKELYMGFLTKKATMNGQLAITSDGIRFEAPKVRIVNPFSTIAVWAAIKFVAKGEGEEMESAFMPLISDPEGQDKSRLFAPMDSDLARAYSSCVSSNNKGGFKNPPLFACVMREASYSLDCHAFVCKCAEDAIVVAANLYQSLVDKMRSSSNHHKEGESGYGSLTRTSPSGPHGSPNQNRSLSSELSSDLCGREEGGGREGKGCGSACLPSSSSGSDERNEHRGVFSDSESVMPVRPPRRKKKFSGIPEGNLKRYTSEDSVLFKIPNRRKSFKKNHNQGKVKKRVQISTPDESSSADSIHDSIDQVLDQIINPGGMSFNDLKPSYQDLLLKIALTLTQDQLYQKSKQAMKKQQLYLRKRSKGVLFGGEPAEDNSQFLNNLLKSFTKIGGTGKGVTSKRISKRGCQGLLNKQRTSVPLPAPRKVILKKPKEDENFMSFCSGCICESCSEKCYCSLPSKQGSKGCSFGKPSPFAVGKGCVADNKGAKHCGYDSESCAESEKCYCSLQRVKSNGLKIYNINLDTETSDTDTNSYDLEPFNNEGQEIVCPVGNGSGMSPRSVEILSYHPSKRLSYSRFSPGSHVQTTNALVHFEDSLNIQSSINTQVGKSNAGKKSEGKRDKVLLITGSSPTAKVLYKDQPSGFGGKTSAQRLMDIIEDEYSEDEESQGEGQSSEEREKSGLAPEKVLSMKKTAEIAAMFTDLKLDQVTNVVPDLGPEAAMQGSEEYTDFEASLGYLP